MLQAISRLVLALALLLPAAALAQTPSTTPPTSSSGQLLSPQQLAALVAPIALYPDNLLAEVLMASTFPTQVVQADRWINANKNLQVMR